MYRTPTLSLILEREGGEALYIHSRQSALPLHELYTKAAQLAGMYRTPTLSYRGSSAGWHVPTLSLILEREGGEALYMYMYIHSRQSALHCMSYQGSSAGWHVQSTNPEFDPGARGWRGVLEEVNQLGLLGNGGLQFSLLDHVGLRSDSLLLHGLLPGHCLLAQLALLLLRLLQHLEVSRLQLTVLPAQRVQLRGERQP